MESSHLEAPEASHLLRGDYSKGSPRFDTLTSQLEEIIQLCSPWVQGVCFSFLKRDFSVEQLRKSMRSCSAELEIQRFWSFELRKSLRNNLDLFEEVLGFIQNSSSSHEDFKDLKLYTEAWFSCVDCSRYLYSVMYLNIYTQNIAPRIKGFLSDLLERIQPSTVEVTRMYLAVLGRMHMALEKDSKPSAEDSSQLLNHVTRFESFLTHNLADPQKDDIVRELTFLLSFIMDGSKIEKFVEGKSTLAQADSLVNDLATLISLLSSSKVKGALAVESNFLLHTFLEKASAFKAGVSKFLPHLFSGTSSFSFLEMNVLGFIDSLLETLNDYKLSNYQIMMLQRELFSLRESNLKDFSAFELQNNHKDLWARIVKVAYIAERAISPFIFRKKPMWYDIMCLSFVIEEVKLIKVDVRRIQHQHTLKSEIKLSPLLPIQANIPIHDKVVVGFKDEVKILEGKLLHCSTKRQMISIVGMPGLGKTTLAKKVYYDTSVRRHFNKWAWCTVSQQFNSKMMLMNVLRDISGCDDDLSNMEEKELEQKVYRSLKGERYLIVLDDIWEVTAWKAVEMSFPDDNRGSRIIFTSRIESAIPEGCTSVPLKPLSVGESWELLRKKLFDQGYCPPNLAKIGKQIAMKSKGLPLSIVLIAGLLKEKVKIVDWWKQAAESLDVLIAEKGCWDVLELSYRHLPEFLKPCFLYFGLFQEDEKIRLKKLIRLWISEGFIQKHEFKSLEVVAEEYLMNLVTRSLVVVSERSSTGGIKACSVHDLLHDFCIAKSEEEKFCKVIRGNNNNNSYQADIYAHYRLSIQTPECWSSFLEYVPPASAVHSLLTFSGESGSTYIKYLSFPYFAFLRVLDLRMCLVHEFLEEITKLVHLRYLACNIGYSCFPSYLKKLRNLETLCLEGTISIRFDLLQEMQRLRHVSVPICEFGGDNPPLVNVQSFCSLLIDCGQESEMLLRKIPNVRKLGCEVCSSKWNPVLRFDFLDHLESLLVVSSKHQSYRLRSCAFHFPQNLKKLHLMNFRLLWNDISPIANLPNLEALKLNNAFSGRIWQVKNGEFLKLKCLILRMLDLQQLKAYDESFPCLERLGIDNCNRLEEIPSRFEEILSLNMIQVKGRCRPNLHNSARKIQKMQLELGNEELEVQIRNHLIIRN